MVFEKDFVASSSPMMNHHDGRNYSGPECCAFFCFFVCVFCFFHSFFAYHVFFFFSVPDLEAALAAQSEAQRWLRKRAYTLIAGKRFLRKATDYLNAGLRAQEFKQIMLSTSIFALQIGLAFSGVPGLGGIVGSATGVSSAVGVQAAVTSASNVSLLCLVFDFLKNKKKKKKKKGWRCGWNLCCKRDLFVDQEHR